MGDRGGLLYRRRRHGLVSGIGSRPLIDVSPAALRSTIARIEFRNLDLNLIAALDALLTERSVSLAARRVHLKQPAMSAALNRLRRYFKDELLVNIGRQMTLTPFAESLTEPVRLVLRQIEATILCPPQKRFDARTSSRTFSIVASDDVVDYFLAPALRQLGQIAPRLGFELRLSVDEPPDALHRGDADLVIVQEPYAADRHPSEFSLTTNTCSSPGLITPTSTLP